jgi:hypothetical protein
MMTSSAVGTAASGVPDRAGGEHEIRLEHVDAGIAEREVERRAAVHRVRPDDVAARGAPEVSAQIVRHRARRRARAKRDDLSASFGCAAGSDDDARTASRVASGR